MKLLSLFVGMVFFFGCATPPSEPKKEVTDVYFYAESEANERLFDEKTGQLKKGVSAAVLDKNPMRIFNGKAYSSMTFADFVSENNAWFIVDGNYAVEFSGEHHFQTLSIADTYARLTGVMRAHALYVGINFMRAFIHPKRLNMDAQASMTVANSLATSSLFVGGQSFFTVSKTGRVLVAKDWRHASPQAIGITIQKPFVEIQGSTVFAPQVTVEKGGALRLTKATVESHDVVVNGSVTCTQTSTIFGNLKIASPGYLLLEEDTDFEPVPNQVNYQAVGIEMAHLVVSETALVDGNVSVRSTWAPGDEKASLAQYKKFFGKHNEFALVQATKLLGRARLVAQRDAYADLPHLQKWHSYFEQFVSADNKKLALEHDYQRGLLKLKIVDKSVVTDKDGCLPDIGAFDRAEYDKFKRQ